MSKTIIFYYGNSQARIPNYMNKATPDIRVVVASKQLPLNSHILSMPIEQIFLDSTTDLTPDALMAIYGTKNLVNLSHGDACES